MRLPPGRKEDPGKEVALSLEATTFEDLQEAEKQVGAFNQDNRAGLDGTLHRISCIRNRAGRIVGLTCRVGRSVKGSAALVADVVKEGRSLLLLGRPGVGKTTAVREIARMLSGPEVCKRTIIVDTSNEIGGDGDVPHPGIGDARRMQVANPDAQDRLMIEAVENHMPQAVIIDEISTEAECMAARTIAQRGVQLIATAHGNVLENVIKNPSLADLVGGIASVTLGDEAARKRGVQKTVLERAAPPTFDVVAEMVDRTHWCIQETASAVDMILAGGTSPGVMRTHDEGSGEVHGMDAYAAKPAEVRGLGVQSPRERVFSRTSSTEGHQLSMSSSYQPGPTRSSAEQTASTSRPTPPRLPMPGDQEEDPTWHAPPPTSNAVKRAAAAAVAAASQLSRGDNTAHASPASPPPPPAEQPTLLRSAPRQPPTFNAPPRPYPVPSPLAAAAAAAAFGDPSLAQSIWRGSASGGAEGGLDGGNVAWPSTSAAAAPGQPTLRMGGGAGGGAQQQRGPCVSVYLLMERNATSKVITTLRQLMAEVQGAAAASGITASDTEVVDSLEDADLVLATRAKLKNSPKVRAAIQRFKLPIYTLRSTSSTSILARDLLPVLGLGATAPTKSTSSYDSESESDCQTSLNSSVEAHNRRGRSNATTSTVFSTKADLKGDGASNRAGSPLRDEEGGVSSYGFIGLDSGSESSGTDSDGWEGDSWAEASWSDGASSSSEFFEVSSSPSAIARLSMRVDTNGNAATMTPADDYADLICSLVRELRYSPLDREYSTQILNSFNMELALATPKQDDGATGGPSNETSGTASSGTTSYPCSTQSIAGLAWALSYTKHKKKFVHANEAALLNLASAAEGRWSDFSGQGLMQLAMGFAGLRVLPSTAWMKSLVEATQRAAAQGQLTSSQAGAISQALVALQGLKPSNP